MDVACDANLTVTADSPELSVRAMRCTVSEGAQAAAQAKRAPARSGRPPYMSAIAMRYWPSA